MAYAGTPAVIFWIAIISLLPVAALFGGMAFLLMALAAGVAVLVWIRPQEAPAAGILFLFASTVLLPYGARLEIDMPNTGEMYYWAAGLLLITVAAVARLGARRVFMIPASAKIFLAVGLLASVFGLIQGVAVSYVLRQFYGILLMVTYLGLALNVGDEALFMRRIQTFGSLCALMFVVYFVWTFAEYGIHREPTTVGFVPAMLASVLFLNGLEQKKRSYVLGAIILLCVPILIFQRGATLTFLAALPLAVAIKARTKKFRVLGVLALLFLALPGFVPQVAEKLGDTIKTAPVIGSILPEDAAASGTLLDRALQLGAAIETVQAHPWLGSGMGAEIEWESPLFGGLRRTPYVENGWAYLLQKMGLLGGAAFLWFLSTVLRGVSRESVGLSACLLAAILITMFNNAVFFHFTTSPCAGTLAGLLLAKRDSGHPGVKPGIRALKLR